MIPPHLLFLSNTTDYRVATIARGVLHVCRQEGFGLVWRDFDQFEFSRLRPQPRAIIVWGKLASIEQIVTAVDNRIPVVSTIGHTLDRSIPTVVPDSAAIARQVAAHLIEEGLRRFIFVGSRKSPSTRWRYEEFIAAVRIILGPYEPAVHFFNVEFEHRFWAADAVAGDRFQQLLRRVELPVGVFAFNDQIAVSCLECAGYAGVKVPQEMAIVGVDDHPVYTTMFAPLSTVRIDYEEIGHVATRLALQLAKKRTRQVTSGPVLRSYVGGVLVVRESSQTRLRSDPAITKALTYLHERHAQVLTLLELAQVAGMSRANFAARFLRVVGLPPIQYLIHLRIDRAKLLLAETALAINEIAFRVGFEDQTHFTRTFCRLVHLTPSRFRDDFIAKRVGRLPTSAPPLVGRFFK